MDEPKEFTPDFWQNLRQYTSARIALGRAGSSLPTRQLLEFQLAHAQARDAVLASMDVSKLAEQMQKFGLPVLTLHSRASNRQIYLQRPDWGRRLNDASHQSLLAYANKEFDISLVIADGLSALAVEKNSTPLFDELLPKLHTAHYKIAPITIVEQGRVAIGDEIGYLLKTRMVIIFIGERPGLSSPDSLGIYLTYQPKAGKTDEQRNCISNVRPEGLPYAFAAEKLMYLIQESFRRELSGVNLKDETDIRLIQ